MKNWLKDAARAFRAAVELAPHDPHLRTQWALVLERAGSGPRAEEQYTSALTLDPEFADAQAGLDRIRGQRCEPEKEQTTWDRVIAWFTGMLSSDKS